MKEKADLDAAINYINHHGIRNWLIKSLTVAFKEARKNKLKTFNEHAYEENWEQNIVKLADAILERHYHPGASITFVIFDPMVREIFAAPFIDRIVHHFLYELNGGWWDHHFINDSYSCRENKGTLYGIERIQKMMRQATHNFTKEAYVIKLDIQGYFMSLPRKRLYQRVKWGLEQQFGDRVKCSAGRQLYEICQYLWHEVLMDDPAAKARRRGPLHHWDPSVLPPEKSLFRQPEGKGIVIGNLTSQLVSNIYLDEFDRFVKFELGYKYYGRYVDDFFIIVPAEEYSQAKRDVKRMEKFLKEKMDLTLHPKKRYYGSVYHGIPFLGARIYPHCVHPSNRLQKKLESSTYKIANGTAKLDTLSSYFGLLKHMQANQYIKKLFAKYHLSYDAYLEMMRSEEARPMREILLALIFGLED